MSKTATFVGLGVVIAALVFGLFKLNAKMNSTPEPSPQVSSAPVVITDEMTADWQEFKNDELKYQLKYPPDWIYTPQATFSKEGVYFRVSVELAKFQNLTDYPIIEDLLKDGYEKIDLETPNGKAKLMLTNHNDKDLANMFLMRDGYLYRLTWNAIPELRHQYAETFKQIVASFKII